MIGKTTKGSGFGGLLRYVFEKEKARYIGSNMAGTTPEELTSEFRALAKRNSKVQIPVARSVEDKADTTRKPQAHAANTWDEQPTRVTDDTTTDANADTDQRPAIAPQESLMQLASAQIIKPVAAEILKEGVFYP